MKPNKTNQENKPKGVFQRISSLTRRCSTISKLYLAIALFLILAVSVSAGDIIAKAGDFYVDGKLGVGTTVPAKLVDIHAAAPLLRLHRTDNANSSEFIILPNGTLSSSNVQWNFGIKGGSNNFAFRSHDGSSTTVRFTIENDGDVGIGESSNSASLDTEGTIRAKGAKVPSDGTGLEMYYSNGISYLVSYNRTESDYKPLDIRGSTVALKHGSANGLSIDASGNVEIGDIALVTETFANYAGFSHKDMTGGTEYALLQKSNGETYINAPSSRNINFRIDNSPKAKIDSNGNMGIGTTTPDQKLKVAGSINVTGDIWYGGSLNSYSPIRFGKDSEKGYTTFCVWDKQGYQNLIYWDNGEMIVETSSPYCNEYHERDIARRECEASNLLFNPTDLSCYEEVVEEMEEEIAS